jgi:hypothetical protein
MMERRTFEKIRYKFSADEIRALGESLARESQSVIDLKAQKATSVAGYQSQIKAASGQVAEFTAKINNGYEVREVECMWDLDNPRPGIKSLLRCDDPSQVIRMEAMTLEEQQQTFKFEEGEGETK